MGTLGAYIPDVRDLRNIVRCPECYVETAPGNIGGHWPSCSVRSNADMQARANAIGAQDNPHGLAAAVLAAPDPNNDLLRDEPTGALAAYRGAPIEQAVNASTHAALARGEDPFGDDEPLASVVGVDEGMFEQAIPGEYRNVLTGRGAEFEIFTHRRKWEHARTLDEAGQILDRSRPGDKVELRGLTVTNRLGGLWPNMRTAPGSIRYRLGGNGVQEMVAVFTHNGVWAACSTMDEATRICKASEPIRGMTEEEASAGWLGKIEQLYAATQTAQISSVGLGGQHCTECGAREGQRHGSYCKALIGRPLETTRPMTMHSVMPGHAIKNMSDVPMIFAQVEGDGPTEHVDGSTQATLARSVTTLENELAAERRVVAGLTEHINRLLYGEKPHEPPAGVKPAINLGGVHERT